MGSMSNNAIPIIDINPWISTDPTPESRDVVIKEVRDACVTYGFFQLVGHGVPEVLQEKVFNCAETFFALPTDEKMEVSIKKSLGLSNRGYEAIQAQTLQPGMLPDLKEGYFIGAETPPSDPRAGDFLTGPNQWPKSLSPTEFEVPLQDYRSRMVRLAETVLRILALGLPAHLCNPHLFDKFMIQPSGNLRLLHYPPQSSQDERQLGAGAHTDFGGITFLLQQPGTTGLQVLYPPTKEWIPVPATENSFVVNIGDLLEIWTGGFYRSAVHRVINTGVKHRYSAPFFYNGNMDLRFTPLNGAQGETTVETHIRGKLSATHKQTK